MWFEDFRHANVQQKYVDGIEDNVELYEFPSINTESYNCVTECILRVHTEKSIFHFNDDNGRRYPLSRFEFNPINKWLTTHRAVVLKLFQ